MVVIKNPLGAVTVANLHIGARLEDTRTLLDFRVAVAAIITQFETTPCHRTGQTFLSVYLCAHQNIFFVLEAAPAFGGVLRGETDADFLAFGLINLATTSVGDGNTVGDQLGDVLADVVDNGLVEGLALTSDV